MDVVNNPEDPSAGTRKVPFSRVLYIEQDDFREDPPKKFFRLAPGREVRLRNAYFITCTGVVKDPRPARSSSCAARTIPRRAAATRPTAGRSRRRCTGSRPRTRFRRKCGSTIGCSTPRCPGRATATTGLDLNPASLEVVREARIEPSAADSPPGTRYQFERLGYFCVDPDSGDGRLVFNRTVTLKDSWAKIAQRSES